MRTSRIITRSGSADAAPGYVVRSRIVREVRNAAASVTYRRFLPAFALAFSLLCLPAMVFCADVRLLTTADGLPSNWITALAPAPEGRLWVGTGDAGLFLWEPGRGVVRGYRASDGLPSDEVVSVAVYAGKVHAGTATGLAVLSGDRWEATGQIQNVTLRNVRLWVSPDGKELWACSVYLAGGLLRFDGRDWAFMGGEGRGLFNDVQGLAFGSSGVLLGTGAGAAYLKKGAEVVSLTEGLPPVNIFTAGALGENFLLGTNRGLWEHAGSGWREVSLPEGFAKRPVFALAVRGAEWIAGAAAGLAAGGAGEPRVLTEAAGVPLRRVMAVATTADAVYGATAGGLLQVRKW